MPSSPDYRIAPQRSGWARQRLLGRRFGGRIISDRLGAYNDLPPPRRQLCWAHLIRDFRGWQAHPPAEPLARSCEQQAEALFAEWHRFRAGPLSRAELQQALTPIQQRLRLELERGTVCGVSRVERSSKQLLKLWDALWSFAEHDEVEPTNNEAERALRTGVIWRKTSFGSQSGRGLRLVERLLTIAETCRKQKQDLLGFLTDTLMHTAPASFTRR